MPASPQRCGCSSAIRFARSGGTKSAVKLAAGRAETGGNPGATRAELRDVPAIPVCGLRLHCTRGLIDPISSLRTSPLTVMKLSPMSWLLPLDCGTGL